MKFSEHDFLEYYCQSFKKSELGRIYERLPLKAMAKEIYSRMPERKPQGNKHNFPPEGEIALMFLKPYTGLSDDELIEMLNGSIHMQIFCGVLLDTKHPIKYGKIVSAIRNRLAPYLDIKAIQKLLYEMWSPEIEDKELCLTDATCYESHLRFPTDVKLLWECCEWLYPLLHHACREARERLPRTKYDDVDKARLKYAKKHKQGKKEAHKLRRRERHLLEKLWGEWIRITKLLGGSMFLTAEQEKRLAAIRIVLRQQKALFNEEEVKHRIVSIDRPYIRPIVRGKENKQAEFGAKCNNIQIEGISFIEHHSFEAFNEGIRQKECIRYQEELTRVKVEKVGADRIYATNDNRRECTENGVHTCFVRKGPRPKEEPQETRTARRIIGNLTCYGHGGEFRQSETTLDGTCGGTQPIQ